MSDQREAWRPIERDARTCALVAGLTLEQLRGRSQDKSVCAARHRAMWLSWRGGASQCEIARYFGRDHSSVTHAIGKERRARQQEQLERERAETQL